MDLQLILDTVEAESPGLRDLARRFLKAEAEYLGVPLDEAIVLARRTEGVPEVHVTAATDQLVSTWRRSRMRSAAGAASWRWPTPERWQ